MTPEQRDRIIEILESGQELDREWEHILFPPERREYELVYHGKERREEILAETMAVPLQPVRTFGRNGNGWHNMLVFGDNLQVCKTLLEMKRRGQLKNEDGTDGLRLVYIDPPFATKHDFKGNQDQKAYQDKIVGAGFLEFLRRRLVFIRELLADDGVIFVHTDWKKGHYIKVLLDELFGESRFRNEIIWWYYNKMQGNVNRFPSNHEAIYFYSAGSEFHFDPPAEERAGGTHKLLKRVWDSKTKRLVNAKNAKGEVIYIETDERRVDDVWRLSMLQPADRTENIGYPTQKPETLLSIILEATSKPGDLVMDCFAGSGTTLAVAEKLGRRWVGIDCGKFAIYTMQKRLLNLKNEIGNTGSSLKAKPFTLYNAGLYDFTRLRELPWEDWRFFALQLFQCRDEPHSVGGVHLDGFLKGGDVLVFNHFESPKDAKVTYDTIDDLHEALGSKVGRRFMIIAPSLSFAFQEDYVDRGKTRYYALRIPYSIINELHRRQFTAIRQPADEMAVNDTVESVGFDFIRTPQAKISYRVLQPKEKPFTVLQIKVNTFKSEVACSVGKGLENLESLSAVMIDVDYDGEVFDLDEFYYAERLRQAGYTIEVRADQVGKRIMVVLIDIHGNEFREVKTAQELGLRAQPAPKSPRRIAQKRAPATGRKAAQKVATKSSRKTAKKSRR